jgi:hypothetical protein
MSVRCSDCFLPLNGYAIFQVRLSEYIENIVLDLLIASAIKGQAAFVLKASLSCQIILYL